MKRIVEVTIAAVSFLLLIVITPFIAIFNLFNNHPRVGFIERWKDLIQELDGKNFFCYNNRSDSIDFIEGKIVPFLNKDTEILFLNGKEVESNYPKEFVSDALLNLKHYQNFPHLMKIRKGKIIEKSINNALYNTLNQNQTKEELVLQINNFFSS